MENEFEIDLLDLRRLNQLEVIIKESPAIDRDEMLKAINYKKRQKVLKLRKEDLPTL